MAGEIPAGVTILKTNIIEPYAWALLFSKKKTRTISSGIIDAPEKQNELQQLLLYIRGNFFIPDARRFWVRPSVRFLSKYLKKNDIDVIITTGPPHSLHLIGLKLKAKTGLRWVADFRDPWTAIGYHDKLKLTKASQKKHLNLERKVLNTADHIITTSPGTKKDFEKLTTNPITCITNGFEVMAPASVTLDDAFSLSHIGSLLADRNPKILWEVLNELKKELDHFGKDLKIKLAGKVSEEVIRSIKMYDLEDNLEVLGYLSHDKALQMQRETQVLLLIEINAAQTRAIIPGKVFEYLAAQRPILGIGPQGADFFEIIKRSAAGSCFDYNQKAELKSKIIFWYKKFKTNDLHATNADISEYSRKNLTKKLAGILKKNIA